MWDRSIDQRLRPGAASGLLLCLAVTWGLGGFAFPCTHLDHPAADSHAAHELRVASSIAETSPGGACPACLLHATLKILQNPPRQPWLTGVGPADAPLPEPSPRELAAAAANARAPPAS